MLAHLKKVEERYKAKQRQLSKQAGPGAARGHKYPDRMRALMKADDEYRRLLKVMDRDPNFDQEEIQMFEKTEIMRRSIEVVHRSASKQAEARRSLEELQFVPSRIHRNLEVQQSLSPGNSPRRLKQKKKKKKANKDLQIANYMKKVGKVASQPVTPAKRREERPQTAFGTTVKEKREEEYNPFGITALEMRRIRQSVHLTDEALKKLWEREKMIKEYEHDLSYI
jgi:hypothetical protein